MLESVVGFYLKYAEGNLKDTLTSRKDTLKVKYLQYDWSLNDLKKVESEKYRS